ncbi:MAG TPA: DUF131 domain-containing protein [Candidatus Bathyarchaeota archaeon]|nr:DUF131 domain-containing protein [Candidatus Bathyarchaeota archaeon]
MYNVELSSVLFLLGFSLIIVGVILIFLETLSAGRIGRGGVGGVILIGPIPIIFGSGTRVMRFLTVASLILFVAAILFYVFLNSLGPG